MSRYSQRVEALEHNEKKKKLLFGLIIAVLVIIFLGGMAIGAKQILEEEGTFDPYAEQLLEPMEAFDSKEDAVKALRKTLSVDPVANTTKLKIYTDIWVNDDSLECSDERLKAQLIIIKGKILDNVKTYYDSFESSFGQAFQSNLSSLSFNLDELRLCEAKIGRKGEDNKVYDTDSCFFNFRFSELEYDDFINSSTVSTLGAATAKKIIKRFQDDISSIAKIKEIDIRCSDFAIEAKTNLDNRLSELALVRGYKIKLCLDFCGELEGFGTQSISFDYYAKENHIFTSAGIRLSHEELRIEKGKLEALEAFKTADEEVTISWSSSNPEIASVDEDGYVKGHSYSQEPVIITAAFDYLGYHYEDSCTVYVRKPVAEVEVSPKKASLKVGDSITLTAELSPKNATLTELIWLCEDASIAAVDQNGRATALSVGTVKVFCVTEDGHFRSSCTITVSE